MNRKQRRAMRMHGREAAAGGGRTQSSAREQAGQLFGQAVWHQHHGKPNEAASLYKQVLELDPDHAEASNNLGCLLLAQGKRSAAAGCFERALMLLPQLFDDFDSVAAMLLAVNPALGEGVERAVSAWPQRLSTRDVLGASDFAVIYSEAGPSQRGEGDWRENGKTTPCKVAFLAEMSQKNHPANLGCQTHF